MHICGILSVLQMASAEPGQQFMRISFGELDSPAFMRLARSPEFSTYLTLRRYIWRSHAPYSRRLQQWYADGYLCCGLSRARIARCLGGEISIRAVCRDLARLLAQGVIEVAGSGRGQVFILGRWEGHGGQYRERYYLQRLGRAGAEQEEDEAGPEDAQPRRIRGDSPRTTCADAQPRQEWRGSADRGGVVPPVAAQPRNNLPANQATTGAASAPEVAHKNRVLLNRECGIEGIRSDSKSDDQIWNEVLQQLRLQLLRATYETFVARTTARRVDGHPRYETRGSNWEITCVNALAQDWLEHRLGVIIRRELAAVVGEGVGEVVFRVR
jgi:hypothetical protein